MKAALFAVGCIALFGGVSTLRARGAHPSRSRLRAPTKNTARPNHITRLQRNAKRDTATEAQRPRRAREHYRARLAQRGCFPCLRLNVRVKWGQNPSTGCPTKPPNAGDQPTAERLYQAFKLTDDIPADSRSAASPCSAAAQLP